MKKILICASCFVLGAVAAFAEPTWALLTTEGPSGEARRPRRSGRGNGRAHHAERPLRGSLRLVDMLGASGAGAEGRCGPQTAFMAKQRKVFLEYLKVHPETESVSRIIRARECWAIHRKEWDAAAKKGIGYSGHKALAYAKLI